MKKLLFLMSLCLCINSQAADIYVNSSGQAGSYSTLAGALAAANNGDRILVSHIITLTENDTIDKSVTISSISQGNFFEFIGDLYIKANSGLEIRIIGIKLNGEINSISGNASGTNNCNLYVIDSEISGNIICDVPGLKLNLLYNDVYNNMVVFRFGKLIANKIGSFYLAPGDSINYNDTVFIIANRVNSLGSNNLNIYTNYNPVFDCRVMQSSNYNNSELYSPTIKNAINTVDHFYFVANNLFIGLNNYGSYLYIASSNSSSNGGNKFLNNTFLCHQYSFPHRKHSYGGLITFFHQCSHANTTLTNNIFTLNGATWVNSWNQVCLAMFGSGNDNQSLNNYEILIDSNYKPFFDFNSFGSNNGSGTQNNSLYSNYSVYSTSLNNNTICGPQLFDIGLTNIIFNTAAYIYSENGKSYGGAVNVGKNSIQHYDIDMTRNDLGTYGGPYSWDNYWNTASGSARIYNLDLPFEIWSGQPNVKADAVHQK